MKTLVLLSLILISKNIMASDTAHSSLEYIVTNLNQLSISESCTASSESDLRLTNCDQRSSDHITEAAGKISAKLSKVQTDLKKLKPSKFVSEVEKVFKCIEKRVSKKVKFECTDSYLCKEPYNYVMYVEEIPDQLFQENIIRSCSEIFSYTADQLAGIILHEVSHLCGTSDLEYIKAEDARPKLQYQNESGSKNADSYRYWLEKGFCLPEKDC